MYILPFFLTLWCKWRGWKFKKVLLKPSRIHWTIWPWLPVKLWHLSQASVKQTCPLPKPIPCISVALDAGPETVDCLAYKGQLAVKTASVHDVLSSDEALGSAFKASASPQLSIPPGTAQYPSISNTLDAVPAGLETFQSQRRGWGRKEGRGTILEVNLFVYREVNFLSNRSSRVWSHLYANAQTAMMWLYSFWNVCLQTLLTVIYHIIKLYESCQRNTNHFNDTFISLDICHKNGYFSLWAEC